MFRKLPEFPGGALTIYIDGQPVEAGPGESVAAVLLRQDEPWSRLTPVTRSLPGTQPFGAVLLGAASLRAI